MSKEYTIEVYNETDLYDRYFRVLDKDRKVLSQSIILSLKAYQPNILKIGYENGRWYLTDIYGIKSFFKETPFYFHICCGETFWWRVNGRLVLTCMEYKLSEYVPIEPIPPPTEPIPTRPEYGYMPVSWSYFLERYWFILIVVAVLIAVVVILLAV